MTAVRLLVTGGSGQVGAHVVRLAAREGYRVVAPKRADCDLADAGALQAFLDSVDVEAIINCAAYTAVDRAEAEPDLAHRVNAVAPQILAAHAAARHIPLLHVSTDYVFEGLKQSAYTEDDAPAPQNVYGTSKWAGERAIIASGARYAILRTAWLQSAGGANFINTMLRLAQTRDNVGVVDDQLGCPTAAEDVAEALLVVAEALMATHRASSIWHFVNTGRASWHDLAATVFAEAAQRGHKIPQLNRITSAEYPTPAKRPANSELSTLKFQSDFGYVPRHWRAAVGDVLAARLGVAQS